MAVYKPTELNALLEQLGTHPKRKFSQNFLIDGNVIRKIADLAQIQSGDEVVEIGSGPGALTEELLKRGARLFAIERDPIWADSLARLAGDLTIYQADVLKSPIDELVQKWKKNLKVKLVANLPYHITTPILTRFAPLHLLFSDLVVMVQEEVARRYTALPGSREYGSITVFLDFWTDASYGFKVKNSCFYPSPKVDSAIIHLLLKPPPLPFAISDRFFHMTRQAFGQRRKMLKTSLKEWLTPDAYERWSLLLSKRPETLSLNEFIALFEYLESHKAK